MQKIIGFHGTKQSNIDSIMKQGFRIPKPKEDDNHWLGHGIYFYDDFELAEWWADKKVRKHNEKYNQIDRPAVIRATINARYILDLDTRQGLIRFNRYKREKEKAMVANGIVVDFTKSTANKQKQIEIQRCFWLDCFKADHNIEVVMYTFDKSKASYAEAIDAISGFRFFYHEKQICVSNNEIIENKEIVHDDSKFNEVIV